MMDACLMHLRFPVKHSEVRELLVMNKLCPECGGDLDPDWECLHCLYDARPVLAGWFKGG